MNSDNTDNNKMSNIFLKMKLTTVQHLITVVLKDPQPLLPLRMAN